MQAGRRALLLLLVVLGLTAASIAAIVLKPATLGLDLRGGVEVVLQGEQITQDAPVNSQSINRALEVIRRRVDSFGVSGGEIQTAGTNQIVVSLPGVKDPTGVVNDLTRPANLAFYDFSESVVNASSNASQTDPNFMSNPSLYAAVRLAERTTPKFPNNGAATLYAFTKAGHRAVGEPVVVGITADTTPQQALAKARGTLADSVRKAGHTMAQVTVETVPKGLLIVSQVEQLSTRAQGRTVYFIFQDNPGLTGKDISSAAAIRDVGNGGTGKPEVTMNFTDAGSSKFHTITRDLARRGNIDPNHTLYQFAIVLDNQLISAPTINGQELPDGISGGAARITGNFTVKETRTLASQLNSGSIPIRMVAVSTKQVGATLGKASLHQGLLAGLAGLITVIAFLLFYYRLLGVVAVMGLLIYAALFYAVVVLVPITLTLPGIAGVILTIGISSDANVVIFERVREEARAGKSTLAALSAGYRKGLAAIIDANVVTFFTAVLVFMFATAGPKGFAFTLGIGVLMSLLTAVVATRAIFGVLLGSRFLKDDRALALKHGRVFTIDWVGRWRLWVVLSTIPVLFGLGWMGAHGLNLGLDFTSGSSLSATFVKPASEGGIRDIYAAQGVTDLKVQAYSQNVNGSTVRGFQVNSPSLNPTQSQKIQSALDAKYQFTDTPELTTVGATFGRQIIRNAITAVILSFIVVALYLILRFEYKLALPAMLSVVHDVALSLGIYAVTGRKVTGDTVAALLTILGYSLYDVVIVFDRIRENQPLMRGRRYRDIVNLSVNEVFTRSIITSVMTLLPVLSLFLFGGSTLKDFAFALLVGILSGGVSSIIISAPLASWWKERDPDERRKAVRAERKRQRMIASDADVVDLAVLERAESALDDDAPVPGLVAPAAPADEAVPAEAPVQVAAPDVVPQDAADGVDVDVDAPPAEPTDRPARDRPRRHTQVQRRRRR
ncbi:MAG: protein translocase subunit SecD [Thermoleophilia bacterium]